MKANTGDLVQVRYKGWKASTKEVFDTNESNDKPPLKMKIGSREFIAGFNEALMGMEEGEKKEIFIPMHKAYGPKHKELFFKAKRTDLIGKSIPKVGKIMALKGPRGNIVPAIITQITDEEVIMDMNPALAGEDLVFRIYLEKIIRKAE